MDWQRYKRLCDEPRMMSRWMLTETAALLPEQLRAPLEAALSGTPLAKPADHAGGPETDMFPVCLDAAADILAAVEQAAARGATTTTGRGLGGFVAAWREARDAAQRG